MGHNKFVLLSLLLVVIVVSSQNYPNSFIPGQQNNPTAKKNIEVFMDRNTDCNSDKVREVGDKVVNVYGHGVGQSNQEGLALSCTVVLNTDSPREPKRFKITIVAMRIRSCGVQFYMYDGSDQGGRIMGSFDCNRGMDQLQGFNLYHSTGSQFGFSLARQDPSQFDYDIRLHIEPVIASLDWSDGGGWGTGSIYDVDKFSQETIIGIIGGCFLLCIVLISMFIACYCLRSKGKTLPPREIILRSDYNSVHNSAKTLPEPSEKVWMSDLSSVGNTMKSTKTVSSLPPKGRYQPSEDGSNYSDDFPRHSRRYGNRSERPRRYDDPPRYEARGYRSDHRREPPRYDDMDDRPPRRFGRPRGHDHPQYDEYDDEPPMNRNRSRPPPRRGKRTEAAFENTSFIEPDDNLIVEKVIEPRVRPKKSTATDPINVSDEEEEKELSDENQETDSEPEEESEEEEEEEESEDEEDEDEKTEKKGFTSTGPPQQTVQLPPQQFSQPPQMTMQPQFGTLPPNYQPPPYNVAHTFMPVPLTQQGVPMMAGPVQTLPPRYMPSQPHVLPQPGPNQYKPASATARNEPAQKSTPPIYNYLVRRGYTPIDGRSSPISSSTAASNLSDNRPYHTDDSDQPANIDSGVEFMKRTTTDV